MRTALIVDDTALVRRIARKILEGFGFSCREAEDGTVALTRLKEEPADLVLLDWEMPNMNGMECLQAIRADDSIAQPRIIMCTTHNSFERIAAAIQAGADEYVMKPFDAEIISDKLRLTGFEV